MSYLAILIGGGIGALFRFLLSRWLQSQVATAFPLGTLAVNLLGSFLIGFLAGLFERSAFSPRVHSFVFVGLLGGFTTFSSYSLETLQLFRSSASVLAWGNVLLSNGAGLLLVAGGYYSASMLFKPAG